MNRQDKVALVVLALGTSAAVCVAAREAWHADYTGSLVCALLAGLGLVCLRVKHWR